MSFESDTKLEKNATKIEMPDIEKAEEFLRKIYQDERLSEGSPIDENLVKLNLEHSDRVRKNAREIAEEEGLQPELLEIAGLLHDVAKLNRNLKKEGGIDTWHHHENSVPFVKEFLENNLGKTPELSKKIQNMIERHSDIPFIRRYWQNVLHKEIPSPETPEDIALRDADTLDQLRIDGISKIVHFRQVPGSDFYKEDGGDIQKAIASAHKSFEEAASVIQTKAGHRLAELSKKEANDFFDALRTVKTLDEFDIILKKFEEHQ